MPQHYRVLDNGQGGGGHPSKGLKPRYGSAGNRNTAGNIPSKPPYLGGKKSAYKPFKNPEAEKARRQFVRTELAAQGMKPNKKNRSEAEKMARAKARKKYSRQQARKRGAAYSSAVSANLMEEGR